MFRTAADPSPSSPRRSLSSIQVLNVVNEPSRPVASRCIAC